MAERRGISSFSVLLLMAVAAVVGIACLPRLKVQYTPTTGSDEIRVVYYYPGASARTVEAEVTSKLEGVFSTIRSVSSTRSVSEDGGGMVSVVASKRDNIEAVRFEVASQIRNIYASLPEGCTYPSISLNAHGEKSQTAIAYSIRSALPSQKIAEFVERELCYPLSTVKGVSSVDFYGQTPFEWVITFDADRAGELGIGAGEIRKAIVDYYRDENVGLTSQDGQTFSVRLRSDRKASGRARDEDFSRIPVRQVNGRVVRLGDLATFRYQESLPNSYYRVNGLNVLMMSVEVSSDANLLGTVQEVKDRVAELQESFPEEIGISVAYDSSEYVADELDKIYFRTFLCLLILLLFVFVAARSWRYMAVIAITLTVNLLISIALYFFLGLQIHIYTLAGVTVSLGIIIDNSIVMIDHYVRHHDRRVFPSLLCAVLTTVAALLVVLLMPEEERINLTDFSWVIVINLCVSLMVSYLFVPALLEYFPVSVADSTRRPARLRRLARRRAAYGRRLTRGLRHRWAYWVLLVVLFGIPTCLLPTKFGNEDVAPLKKYEKVLNKIVGWKPYADNKATVDRILSSSFGLFHQAMSRSDFYREPARPQLSVTAGMPEGCTVQQLNQVVRSMENYLAQIPEIETFETQLSSYDYGSITVWFKPEYEKTWLPLRIKSDIISMASNFGGANWRVSGLDQNYFNNNIVSNYRQDGIYLTGYNYDELISYGERLVAYLKDNRRIVSPEIWSGSSNRYGPRTEFNLHYDFESLTARGVSPYTYYGALQSPLFDANVRQIAADDGLVTVRLASSAKDELDLWHIDNAAVSLGEGKKMKLSEVGGITKDRTGLDIQKENQSYRISVRFDFVGSYQLRNKVVQEAVEWMNASVLPIGFRASDNRSGWFYGQKEKYAGLILLVIALIFVICAIYFNSLRLPLAIILMIPLSFVGVFLVFGLSNFTFDKGGFAAFVMLCGITVNAGIYLLSAWREDGNFLHAFSRKILPISLTILSTVLGLIPFLFDGPGEVFWFSFAVGTIAGLLFSVLALLFYLPVFVLRRAKTKSSISQRD